MPGINTNKHVLYGIVAVVLGLTVAFYWSEGRVRICPVCRPLNPTVGVFLPHHFDRHILRQVNAIKVLDIQTKPKHVILITYRHVITVEGLSNVLALSYLR